MNKEQEKAKALLLGSPMCKTCNEPLKIDVDNYYLRITCSCGYEEIQDLLTKEERRNKL